MLGKGNGEVPECSGDFAMFVAEGFPVQVHCLAVQGFGIGKFAFAAENRGQVVQPRGPVGWVLGAGEFLSHFQGLASKGFGLRQPALEHEDDGEVVQRLGEVAVTVGMKLPAQINCLALHPFGGRIIAKVPMNYGDPFPEVRFDLRLIGELGADAFGGVIENFFEDRRVAAFGDFRPSTGEHVFEELGDLAEFGSFGPGLLFVGLGLPAESDLRLFGRNRPLAGFAFPHQAPRCDAKSEHERRSYTGAGGKGQLVPANQFLDPIKAAGRAGHDKFVVQVPLNV